MKLIAFLRYIVPMLRKAVFLLLLFVVFQSRPVSAQDTTASESAVSQGSETAREQFLKRREDARANGSQIQSEVQAEIDAQRQVFRQRILQIQDEAKQKAIERIDNKIQVTNQSITDRFADILENLESINTRIESKSQELQAAGKDTQSLDQAIDKSTEAITTAKAAVKTQASKDYIIDIQSDDTLKASATQTVSSFRTDINELRTQITEARSDVISAAKIAESI